MTHDGTKSSPNIKLPRPVMVPTYSTVGPLHDQSKSPENFEASERGFSVPEAKTTQPGYVNRNGQVVVRNTGLPGNDKNQYIYQLGCSNCGHIYGANGADIHLRLCPAHQGGAMGLDYTAH